MKKSPARKQLLIWGSVSFVVALIAALGVRSYLQHRAYQDQMRKVAASMQQIGIVSQDEYIRVRTLRSSMLAGQKLSDEDFDWCLVMLNQTKPYSVANALKNAMMIDILLSLPKNNGVTPERKERLYKAVAPLLRSNQQLDRLSAMNLMRDLKETRAVPDILPLLNDPDPRMRPIARKALDKMGYQAGGKAS